MFRGSSFHTIDAKGRIIVPARFREAVRAGGADAIMVSQMDRCLVGYPLEEWQKIEDRIMTLAEKSESLRRFRRVFIGGAHECTFDRQDRILIPPTLRQYAAMEKQIVMVGVLDHFEIWSKANWDAEHQRLEDDMKIEEVRNEIARLGL